MMLNSSLQNEGMQFYPYINLKKYDTPEEITVSITIEYRYMISMHSPLPITRLPIHSLTF